MNASSRPSPSELPFPRYEALLMHARELVDNATTSGTSLDFDNALRDAQTFDEAYRMPVVPIFSEKALIDLDDTETFRLAESLDTVMSFSDPETRLVAATIANDLYASLLYSPAGQKRTILEGVLGIFAGEPIPQQLERRYFGGKSEDEQRVVLERIFNGSRTIAAPRQ